MRSLLESRDGCGPKGEEGNICKGEEKRLILAKIRLIRKVCDKLKVKT
jgi:hypothetical protein